MSCGRHSPDAWSPVDKSDSHCDRPANEGWAAGDTSEKEPAAQRLPARFYPASSTSIRQYVFLNIDKNISQLVGYNGVARHLAR